MRDKTFSEFQYPDSERFFQENGFGYAPYPRVWVKFHDYLKTLIVDSDLDEHRKQSALKRLDRQKPLILSAWNLELDEIKRYKLECQLRIASRYGVLEKAIEWLKSMPEGSWYHGGEGPLRDFEVSFSASLSLTVDASDEDEAAALAVRSIKSLDQISNKISFRFRDVTIENLRVKKSRNSMGES